MVNVHYPQTKGYNKRGGYNGYQGHSGRGMMFNANPRGFANGAHGFGRGQLMHIQSYRPTSYNRSISNAIICQNLLSTKNEFGENIPVY